MKLRTAKKILAAVGTKREGAYTRGQVTAPCKHCGRKRDHMLRCPRSDVRPRASCGRRKHSLTTAATIAEAIKQGLHGQNDPFSDSSDELDDTAAVEVMCDGAWWEITVKRKGGA